MGDNIMEIVSTAVLPCKRCESRSEVGLLVMNPKVQMRIIHRSFFSVAMVCCLASAASAEWKEQVLYSFLGGTDGAVPIGGIVRDKAGNLYGATLNGGSSSCAGPGQCGVVYQLTPPAQAGGEWIETILYTFKGYAYSDGATPEGGVIMDGAGNLYGTTGYGGNGSCPLLGAAVGCGTVYELSPPAKPGDPWTETVLYSFQGGDDGYVAAGDLVFDTAGNLYGATLFGGGQGTSCDIFYGGQCGIIFELSPPAQKGGQWTEAVLHSFGGGADGAVPNGGLVLDASGAIYGTTFAGGNETGECDGGIEGVGCGTVFRLVRPTARGGSWRENVLLRFDGTDGATPVAGVTFDANGNLDGTVYAGGTQGYGGIIELAAPLGTSHNWYEKALYAFKGGNSGNNPMAGLVLDTRGDLYGTTYSAGALSGAVFGLKPPSQGAGSWTFAILYGFKGSPDGAQPASKLILDTGSTLYGTTQKGGTGACSFYGCGTVFEISP